MYRYEVYHNMNKSTNDNKFEPSIVIACNKSDLIDKIVLSHDDIKKEIENDNMLKSKKIELIDCSAKNGDNMNQLLKTCIIQVRIYQFDIVFYVVCLCFSIVLFVYLFVIFACEQSLPDKIAKTPLENDQKNKKEAKSSKTTKASMRAPMWLRQTDDELAEVRQVASWLQSEYIPFNRR